MSATGPSVRAGARALARSAERPGRIVAVADQPVGDEPRRVRFAVALDGEVSTVVARIDGDEDEHSEQEWAETLEQRLAEPTEGEAPVRKRWQRLTAERPAEIVL